MNQSIQRIEVALDLGQAKREALRYANHNPEVTLGDFLRVYPARALENRHAYNWFSHS